MSIHPWSDVNVNSYEVESRSGNLIAHNLCFNFQKPFYIEFSFLCRGKPNENLEFWYSFAVDWCFVREIVILL